MNDRRISVLLPALALLLLLAPMTSHAQEEDDDNDRFRVRAALFGGYGVNLTDGYEGDSLLTNTFQGSNGAFRLIWRPEHLLSFGVEVGYVTLVEANARRTDPVTGEMSEASIDVAAVPIFGLYSLQVREFEATVGIGAFFLLSDVDSDERRGVESADSELGYMVEAAWLPSIDNRLNLGIGVQLLKFTERPTTFLTPRVQVRYTLFSY